MMRQGLAIVVAGIIVIAGVTALPAAAELVPGGWAEPIPVPPPQPPAAEPAATRPPPAPLVHAPPRHRVHRPAMPAARPPRSDGSVQF